MKGLFYSTGQVARQLGTTQATIRVLCENGLMAAETTPGGQWRVPSSEVERLKRDGVPPIPRLLPAGSSQLARNGTAGRHSENKSVEVVLAADQVAITRSLLEKRKIDKELEETEDYFRGRQRELEEAEAAECQKAAARQAQQRRLLWEQEWMQYALDSVPYAARREVEMEVHTLVREALSELQPDQPRAVLQRLVDAAVYRALRPWTRKQEMERALQAGMDSLPWDVRFRPEHAPLKQSAWNAGVAALGKVREAANYSEMETTAEQAVQPMIREYEHQQACQRILGRVHIFDATREEEAAATEAVRKALAAVPIGVELAQLEKAAEAALAPHKAAVAKRVERRDRRLFAPFKVDRYLSHISRYLEKEYEFEGGYSEMRREADRLLPVIRAALIDELVENPDVTDDEILESIEDLIDEGCLDD